MRFAQIIRSDPEMRHCFHELPTHSWWWKAILALHGKPSCITCSQADRKRILSQGFRFYGIIYSLFAVLMLVASIMLFVLEVVGWGFWSGMLGLAGIYVLASCLLAFHGARLYPRDTKQASALLIVFFISMLGFLMFFAGAVIVNQHELVADIFILPVTSVFVLIGVGSYLIEILYLFFTWGYRDD